ncbi:class I SAM-dependent methyltransferase [Candidatus Roizmanbacteria bacterium]|nr:class I SAM-dependent methyltransferase [Candidatus Roizmanbacteria bacterium]
MTNYRITSCRICKSSKLYEFLSLGSMPAPNKFLAKEELRKKEHYYPLRVCVCQNCWLMQLSHVIPPKILFRNYLYIPSTSETMLTHFKSLSEEVMKALALKPKSFVVDIGSNDGTLLSLFKEKEMETLGVDPATNLAFVARMRGIDTMDNFFTYTLAEKILSHSGKAKGILATNVFAHIDDLHDACRGVRMLLDNQGLFILEFPYVLDLLENNEFDTIYHEHLSYFSVTPLLRLFREHDMKIVSIQSIPVHGGSVRMYVAKNRSHYKETHVLSDFIEREKVKHLDSNSPYDDFHHRVEKLKKELANHLKRLKKREKRIVGYGASAKGNILTNYCNIGTDILDYIVDSIPFKQGKYTPGKHIPIFPENRLLRDMPDYTLLLAWNFAYEILKKQWIYRERGGRFIITVPHLRIE